MKQIVTIIIATLIATSCTVYQKYTRPEIATDNLYGAIECSDTVTIADISWREFFTDTHLQALIEQALVSNADMQIAAQRVVESTATLRSAKLSFFPSFSFDPSYNLNAPLNSSLSHSYTLPINASWAIDINGATLNSKRSAQSAYEQSHLYRQSVQTALVSAVANSYYTLLMLDAQLAVSRTTAESWRENVRIMKAMKLAGMANEASVSQTEANSWEIEASLHNLEYNILQAENALALLLGTTPQKFSRGSIYEQTFSQSLSVGIPAQLLSRRADVRSAERTLQQAYYATNIAEGAFIPSLTLSGSFGWQDQLGKAVASPGSWIVSFAARLATDIFNAGKKRANLAIARARQEQAMISFRHTLLTAGNEVNNALAKCQTARSKTDARQKQIAALESAVNSTQALMRHSESTYLEVLTAQQKLLNAQLSQIADKFEEIQGTINLYSALGGGVDHNEDISTLPKRERRKK
ncbi:MAG: efflux transporter outer membrane subunit [Alistipes sp.]|nr:efflux transporter outer membrane subunit [Alistipes sp.]